MSFDNLPSGDLAIRPLGFNLLGRPGIYALLVDETGSAVTIAGSVDVKAYFLTNADDALTSAFLTRLASTAGIVVTAVTGQILIDLGTDASVFSAQWLYTLVVELIDNSTGTVVLLNTFALFVDAANQAFSLSSGPARSSTYSTLFVNTVVLTDYVGGTGYLDGVSTLSQPLHCWLQFTRAGAQPEQWELVVWVNSAMNTSTGVYQQPLDFNALTNAKVWIRRS